MFGARGTKKEASREGVDGKDKVKDKDKHSNGNNVDNEFIFKQNSMLL